MIRATLFVAVAVSAVLVAAAGATRKDDARRIDDTGTNAQQAYAWCLHDWQDKASTECKALAEDAARECARATEDFSDSGIAARYPGRGLALPTYL